MDPSIGSPPPTPVKTAAGSAWAVFILVTLKKPLSMWQSPFQNHSLGLGLSSLWYLENVCFPYEASFRWAEPKLKTWFRKGPNSKTQSQKWTFEVDTILSLIDVNSASGIKNINLFIPLHQCVLSTVYSVLSRVLGEEKTQASHSGGDSNPSPLILSYWCIWLTVWELRKLVVF